MNVQYTDIPTCKYIIHAQEVWTVMWGDGRELRDEAEAIFLNDLS